MIKRTFPPGDIREVHGPNWCEDRSHEVIAMWAREAGRKPWSWASLPGTADRCFACRFPIPGHVHCEWDGLRIWLSSERR